MTTSSAQHSPIVSPTSSPAFSEPFCVFICHSKCALAHPDLSKQSLRLSESLEATRLVSSPPSNLCKRKNPPSSLSPPMLPPQEEFFEVESILAQRLVNGKKEVLIKWAGYNEESWGANLQAASSNAKGSSQSFIGVLPTDLASPFFACPLTSLLSHHLLLSPQHLQLPPSLLVQGLCLLSLFHLFLTLSLCLLLSLHTHNPMFLVFTLCLHMHALSLPHTRLFLAHTLCLLSPPTHTLSPHTHIAAHTLCLSLHTHTHTLIAHTQGRMLLHTLFLLSLRCLLSLHMHTLPRTAHTERHGNAQALAHTHAHNRTLNTRREETRIMFSVIGVLVQITHSTVHHVHVRMPLTHTSVRVSRLIVCLLVRVSLIMRVSLIVCLNALLHPLFLLVTEKHAHATKVPLMHQPMLGRHHTTQLPPLTPTQCPRAAPTLASRNTHHTTHNATHTYSAANHSTHLSPRTPRNPHVHTALTPEERDHRTRAHSHSHTNTSPTRRQRPHHAHPHSHTNSPHIAGHTSPTPTQRETHSKRTPPGTRQQPPHCAHAALTGGRETHATPTQHSNHRRKTHIARQ